MRYHELIEDDNDDDLFGTPKGPASPEMAIAKFKTAYPRIRRVADGSQDVLSLLRRLFDLSPDRRFNAGDSISRSAYWSTRAYTNIGSPVAALTYEDSGGGTFTYIGAGSNKDLADALQMLYDTGTVENPEAKRARIAAARQRKLDTAEKKGIRVGSRIRLPWNNGNDIGTVTKISPAGKISIRYDHPDLPNAEYTTTAHSIRKADVINENNDDDLFSRPGELSSNIKQSIKQIQNPYQRTVDKVRDIAKNQFGVKVRVSAQPAKAARGTATFWFGDYVRDPDDPYNEPPKAPPVAHEIKAELERRGFECKFTSSEWLSVRVPPAFSDILDESEDDDELFGDPTHRRIAQWLMNFANVMRNNPAEISGLDPSDGQEYENDLEEIREEAKTVRFVAKVFERQGTVKGLRAWYGYASDWWENFEDQLETDTGISISALYDQHYDQLQENTESDDELFGDTGLRQRLANRFTAALKKIVDEADDLGMEAVYAHARTFTRLFDKWDDGEHDPYEEIPRQAPIKSLVKVVAELEKIAADIYDYIYEESESDDELFADPYKPMSQALDWLNDHDYDELIERGFQFGSGNNDVDILNDYISDAEKPIEVTNVRMNPDNEDDPLVSVRPRSLGEDDASDDELFGTKKMYYVNIMGNYNTGRYADYGARRYIVPGTSPEDALRWLDRNEDWVYMYMDSQKFPNGKRVVRRPARDNVFLDKSTVFAEAPAGSNSAIDNFIRKHRAIQ